ncbi:hypothetical protein [Marivirga sp.]|uniref:hypothetical protein n=1 Tax=Marivirga sp. TaxID=2018662 RepID=UPI002D7EBA3F|nr:hypothetical protein [Marivirga sp.]HET8860889.1 hypothetical protein [Marivirga sp.]
MENQLNSVKKTGLSTFLKFFSFSMALIYLAGGLWFLFSAHQAYVIPQVHIIPPGFVLVGYGLFRSFINYKKKFRHRR